MNPLMCFSLHGCQLKGFSFVFQPVEGGGLSVGKLIEERLALLIKNEVLNFDK